MTYKKAPCIDKECARCCDPVKVHRGIEVPKDECGNGIWKKREELRIPEEHPDTVRLEIYDCLWYDQQKKLCKKYEQRPNICRNTSCIDADKKIPIEQQHSDMINQSFIKSKRK